MGADMLLAMIAHKSNVQPDLDKALAAIDTLTESDIERDFIMAQYDMIAFDDLEGETAAEFLPQIKEILRSVFQDVFVALEDDRTVSYWQLAGYQCYFTGGLSWGDAPTEAFGAFTRISDCGELGALIHAAAGFEYVPTDGPFTITEQELP